MRRLHANGTALGRLGLLLAGATVWMSLAAHSVWAQPANDNFADAIPISGAVGNITGDNINATLEPGEPTLIAGAPNGASVWYAWTAPADGPVTFNTFGSGFDTMLAAYIGTNVANLTSIAENDDYGNTLLSSISFTATAGTTYMIAVDGFFNDMGFFVLNWNTGGGTLAAGDFRFTTGVYLVSEMESFAPRNPFMLAVPTRLTVTRAQGTAGRVLADVTVTNTLYTNIYITNTFGSNIFLIEMDTNGAVLGFSNYIYTNVVVAIYLQDNQYGSWVYLPPFYRVDELAITNENGNVSTYITNYFTNTPPVIFCSNQAITNATPTNVMITNFFCVVTNFLDLQPTARPGFDYQPISAVVPFDDYQMSADIFVTVLPHPITLDNLNGYPLPNRVLVGTITNVALDPLESTSIAPPTAGSQLASTLVNILDSKTYPPIPYQPIRTNVALVGTNIFNFERATMRCTENVNGQFVAHVAVLRSTLDASQGASVNYRIDWYRPNRTPDCNNLFRLFVDEIGLQAGSDYATPENACTGCSSPDYTPVTGTLDWGANDTLPKIIDITITNDPLVEFNEDLELELYYDTPLPTDRAVGYIHTCTLTILFDDIEGGEQPSGAVDRMHNQDNSSATQPPYNLHPGANSTVYAIAVQGDGKTVFGGDFTAFNTVPRNRLARMNVDGQLDTTFDPLDGADGFVSSLTLDASGRIMVAGAFNSINRVPRRGIARLLNNGSLDTLFNPGLGADATIWAMTVQTDGRILVAGEFTYMGITNRSHIARLNANGSLDETFDPGVGPNGTIFALAVQPDGRVYIGGEFTTVNGIPRNRLARLNTDGSLDPTFDPALGADDTVYALARQIDGRLVAGGAFRTCYGLSRNSVARFNPDGTLDLGFDPGAGCDDVVYSVTLQADGRIYIGGLFSFYNQTRRVSFARLLPDGSLDTSFMDVGYNQFAGLITHYWDPNVEPHNFVFDSAVDGTNVIIAGGFTRVGGGYTRDDVRERSNIARLIGGETVGPGNLEFAFDNYTADQNGQSLFISMIRTNGSLGPAAATVTPVNLDPGPGAALPGVDYNFNAGVYGTPTYIVSYPRPTWMLSDGTFGQNQGYSDTVCTNTRVAYLNNDVYIDILDSTNAGNKIVNLKLINPGANDQFLLGGQNIPLGVALGRSFAPLTIVDYHLLHGVFGFKAATYRVNENTNLVVSITRTNGAEGLCTVVCQTLNGTATNNIHYRSNYARLTFAPGETNKTFTVTNINESIIEQDHTYTIRLATPTGGASLGLSNALVTITDDDFLGGYTEFSSPVYFTNENAGFALIAVTRNGGAQGTLAVQFATTNGTAISGTNYLGMTNTLTWANGEVAAQVIAIPIYDDLVVETNNLTVGLRLFAATVNGVTNSQALGPIINATLVITNSDFRGQVAFVSATNAVDEHGGPAFVTVVRTGGSAESVAVNFSTGDATAIAGTDYVATNGTLSFAPGEVSKTFTVPIIDNNYQDLPRFIALTLSNASPAGTLGSPSVAIVNIIDDESFFEPAGSLDTSFDPNPGFNAAVNSLWLQPNGQILVGGEFTLANGLSRRRLARLNSDGSLDIKFSGASATSGVNDSILAIAAQTDQRILIAGRFTNVNGVARNFLARLTYDGAIDTTFNPGAGPSAGTDSPVFALTETFVGPSRKILIGGGFTTLDSIPRNYIARLNDDGSLDTSFDPSTGADGPVFAIAVQTDGKVLLGGDFVTFAGVGRNHIVRLNVDGSIDLSFDPGLGANDSVRSIVLQSDGRILIGGLFTSVNNVGLNHIARLTARGAVDATFTPGVGANDSVTAIAIQADTRIVLGGQFTSCNGVTRHRITRLNNDGTVDPMINFGDGADSFVGALLVQPDRRIVLGGGFTQYDGTSRPHIARIYGGTMGGSGAFEFTSANYQVDENATNAMVVVRRRGGTSGAPTGNVFVNFNTSSGTAVLGSNYLAVSNLLTFPPGEVFAFINIPLIHDFAITPDLTVNLTLSNPQPPGGPALGNQANALLTIVNVDSGISFSSPTYFRNEDAVDGVATMPVLRTGSTRGISSVQFFTTTNGTARIGTNYLPVTNVTLSFSQGQGSNFVQVPVLHDPRAQGNTTVGLQLSNAVNSLLFNPSTATLTIVDVERLPGQFLFSQTNYVVNEADGFLPVTILRTNGRSGIVSVDFSTISGTALPGVKYGTTNGTLTFLDGETNKTFSVPIIQENQVEGFTSFSLLLSNATSGAGIQAPTNVPVTIVDDDAGVTFSSPTYVVPETSGQIFLTVLRPAGTNGVTTVQWTTTNLYTIATNNGATTTNISAIPGTNYVPASGSLSFNVGETIKTFPISILHDFRFTGDVSFGVYLFNPSPPTQVLAPTNAVVVVLDSETGLSFTNSSFGVLKSGTNVLISVARSNVNNGIVSVQYATSNGTAVAGLDYVTSGGTLTFSNGVGLQTFTVPIINNGQAQGDLTFDVRLFNPSPTNLAQIVPPFLASVTITDDVSGLSFSSANYSVNENGHSALITVRRTGFTNSTVWVDYSTADGSARPGINYTPVSGTFVFTNGETVKTFSVPVIDNSVVDGDHTVILSLANPVGNAVLVTPNSAFLTIVEVDGSLVVPSGSALISESGPVNGVIDTNETVTMYFGLRNTSGSNTVALTATLLPTNGVASPSGPQNYGSLIVRGPSASRPFTFTAVGTNGQNIAATFQLRDGAKVLSNAVFNLTIGKAISSWSNTTRIVINDFTNATPYPSIINVSGINGIVTKATVTLTNLSHPSASDIDVLLVSPVGAKSYLMAKCGGFNSVNNITLTFDDAAATSLPTTPLVSGTNRPTSYAFTPPLFPPPAPPAPYNTNLSVFTGSNPNGAWLLYVVDDMQLFSGTISNGWRLNLETALPAAADVGITMVASTGSAIATSNLTYTIMIANYGPANASNIVVSDALPAGAGFISATPSFGTAVTNGAGLVTWSVSSLVPNASASLALVVRPTIVGPMTNTATVTTLTSDPNPDDNTATVVTGVVAPQADLSLGMIGSPNPVNLGNNVTYTLIVTNLGPATATAIGLTNTLPAGVTFVSASPAGYIRVGNVVIFPNLGALGSGGQLVATIVAHPTLPGTITNTANCGSAVIDPLKGNNFASVKTEVQAVQIAWGRVGNNLVFNWSTNQGNFNLESTTNLAPPTVWSFVTNRPPATVPIGSGSKFFRLHGTTP